MEEACRLNEPLHEIFNTLQETWALSTMLRTLLGTVSLLAIMAVLGQGSALLDRVQAPAEPVDLSSPPVSAHENWMLAVEDDTVRVLFTPRDGARTTHVLVEGLPSDRAHDLVSGGETHLGVPRLGYTWFYDVKLEPGAEWRLTSDGWASDPFRLDPLI